MKSSEQPGTPVEINGHCHGRFGKLKDAFHGNFREGGEVGAAVSVIVDGECMVDLWGGHRDAARQVSWRADDIVCVQSVSKEIVALAIHMLVDRGLLDVDDRVSHHWPEYAQNGKQDTRIRWLLDHRAGVPVVDGARPGMAYDWNVMIRALERTTPLWEPGTTPCYHSANYGFPLGELVRRVTGKSVGQFLREEIAAPLDVPCFIGLSDADIGHVAQFLDQETHQSASWIREGTNIFARSWRIFWDDEDFNSREWLRAEIPSVNCHTNARALARIGAVLANAGELDGVRLLSSDTLARAAEPQWTGLDVQNRSLSLSLGFLLPVAGAIATSPAALGMAGAGGATAFADPDHRIGFGYTMNSMDPDPAKPRATALVAALRDCAAG